MAKQLNVALNFTANTEQAKAAIQELQQSLNNIAKMPGQASSLFNDQQIKAASKAALELQQHLSAAVNVNTGKIDLSRFSTSLKAAGKDLNTYYNQLLAIGSTGQQAFLQLAQSISLADVPVTRVNAKLAEMGTTLKNTARWQISSSILHGFQGALQSAFGYAQDLNESLNNIRIVTGQSIDQMAKFAEQANRSAKALSTTTTEYTNASLIYYQQGLSDAEVKERTDVTIKMANAAGVSAQTVSDQMTAVWNNFDDGSKSLEYYADVMTALGAATASSTDEIAAGLEKFAAVSETVGLSYEYATAALATVTATTRQSADVVGNAFKTLFARIQGLQLGDTLDDGTTLNKYSQALEKVGISIFEQNGQMKEMDKILDEMGAKWDTLDKSQQTALAQTVAGVRQYTQLVALMDNWDYFGENLQVALGSEGELQKQADIYAESWEAARDRVQAAAEGIYQNLLDEDFFITLLNGFEKVLTSIDGVVTGLGGMKGALLLVGSVFFKNFSQKMPETLKNIKDNFLVLTGQSGKLMEDIQNKTSKKVQEVFMKPGVSDSYKVQAEGILRVSQMQQQLIKNSKNMTSLEKEEYQARIENVKAMYQDLAKTSEEQEKVKKENKKLTQSTAKDAVKNLQEKEKNKQDLDKQKEEKNKELDELLEAKGTDSEKITYTNQSLLEIGEAANQAEKEVKDLEEALDKLGINKGLRGKALEEALGQKVDEYTEKVSKSKKIDTLLSDKSSQIENLNDIDNADEYKKAILKYQNFIKDFNKSENLNLKLDGPDGPMAKFDAAVEASGNNLDKLKDAFQTLLQELNKPINTGIDELNKDAENLETNLEKASLKLNEVRQNAEQVAEGEVQQAFSRANIQGEADEPLETGFDMSVALSQTASSIMAVSGLITSLTSAFEVFGDESATAMEKFGAGVSIALMALESFTSILSLSKTLMDSDIIKKGIGTVVNKAFGNSAYFAAGGTAALQTALSGLLFVLAAVTIAIGLVINHYQKQKELQVEAAEAAREEAKAKNENVEETKNLVKAYKDSLSSYEEIKNAYEEGTASLEEFTNAQSNLAEQAQAVAENLNIEGAALAKLSGDYSKLTKDIENAQQQQVEDAKEIEEKAKAETEIEFINNMKQGTGHATAARGFKARFGEGAIVAEDEVDLAGILSNKNYQYLSKGLRDHEIVLKTNSDDITEMIAAYEEAQDLYNEALSKFSSAELAKSEVFQNLKEFLNKSTETYEAYKASEETIQEYNIQLKAKDKISGIKDIESYNKVAEGLIQEIAPEAEKGSEEWSKAAEAVHAYLGALSGVSEWATKSQAIEEIAKKTNSAYSDILAEYEKLSDEEKEIFFSVNFDLPGALENLKSTLDYLQEMADNQKIQAQLELVTQGEDLLKNNGTLQEWAAWAAEIQKNIPEFNIADFLSMSSEDQVQWFNNYKKDLDQQSSADRVENIAALEQHLVDLQKENTENAAKSRGANQTRLNDLMELQALEQNKNRNVDEENSYNKLLDQYDLSGDDLTKEIENIQTQIDKYDALQAEIDETKTKKQELENLQALEEKLGWTEDIKKEAEAAGINYDEIAEYAEYLQKINAEVYNTAEAAQKAALSYKRWQKGIKSITDNFEDWNKAIKNQNKDFSKYASTVEDIKDAYKDVFNEVDPELIDKLGDEFLTSAENMELLEKGINGNEDAWNQWETNVLQRLNEVTPAFQGISDQMKMQMDDLVAHAAGLDFSGLTPGASIDDTDFNAKLNSMIFNTAEAANAMCDNLSNVGVDAEIEKHEVFVPAESDTHTYEGLAPFYGPWGELLGYEGVSSEVAEQYGGHIQTYYTIKGAKYNGKGVTGGGGGNKGGGGGGKKQPPKKKSDTDKTRYHTVTNQLEDLKSEYEKISEASNRAFGADKLANMDAEIAKTDELIDKQKEYLAAIEENLPKDKAIMVQYYNEVIGGPEMQFDERGNISNYDEIQDAMYKAWNEDFYNLSEEDREAWEEKYEKVEKYIEQYEETYDLLRDEEQALQELINQRLDLLLEEVQYKVELKINIADDSLEMIEFQLNMLEDNAFRAAEAIEYQTQQAEILYSKMQANEQGLRDILSTSDMSVNEIEQLLAGDMSVLQGHTFTEAQIEAIRDYKSELLSLSEELQEVREEVQERLINAFDQWNEELDKGIEKFDHYNSIMENYKNMIDIVGKEYLKIDNTALGDLSQAMVENNINRVTATRDALKALTQTQIEAREAYEAALQRGNENDIQYWKETLDTIGEEVEAAEEEMMQAWEDALQAAADAFEEAVERAIENFEKALLPFGTLDEFSDAYEKQQEVADQYLADYEKIYELSKLNRDINNSIDDTKSIAGKQKLRGLLNDINKLQEEGTQLSEYDLEYLQKTYDLRMAEIALEEAQKAKDTVRLTRDNEGNWSYAYTTNTDAADDAAQKYEDALYAMQELSSEYVDEMSEQLISTSLEMEEALAAVRMEDYASIEEYYKKLDEIQQYYLDRMTYMQDEMQKALDNNKALYEQDWQNYAAATGYKISDNEDFMMSYKDTVLGTLFGSESDIVDFQQRVNEALGDSDSGLIGELLNAYLQWSKNTNDAMNAAGSSSENFAQDMDNAVHGEGGIVDSSDAATEAVNDMAIQMVAGFDTISSAIERWQTQAGDAADAVIEDYLRTVTAYNMLVETLSSNRVNKELEATLASHAAQTSSYSSGSAYKASTNSSGSDNASDTIGSLKEAYDASYAAMLRNEMKIAQIDSRTSGDSTTYNQASQAYKDYMAKFDTGGYTGEWGPEGKFLMAHEKELILNQNDTKNILNTVQLTRDMLNTIDLNARQASIGLGAMVAGVIKDDNGQVLEQEVHIVAEFPNVTDHNEIEEAFNNLINIASQYANRK